MRVCLYVPDRHLLYSGDTPDTAGVGGGVTVRIRLARALAALGLDVSMVCNCPSEAEHDGVLYRPLDTVAEIDTDVLVVSSSGGALDVTPVLDLRVRAALRLLWVHGTRKPHGTDELGYDFVCAPSNFIRGVAVAEWGIAPERMFVVPNGVEMRHFRSTPGERVPYRLVYASHPAKGLDAAAAVLALLRQEDGRFELHVYGGPRLWGQEERSPDERPGLVYHGLLGQRALADELPKASVAMHLQEFQEPFGVALWEAMAAGCIVVGSPVGAHPELIDDGYNGLLVAGDHMDPETHRAAADRILAVLRDRTTQSALRSAARASPIDWAIIARAWTDHWAWALSGRGMPADAARSPAEGSPSCPDCSAPLLRLSDGSHCTRCGRFMRTEGARVH